MIEQYLSRMQYFSHLSAFSPNCHRKHKKWLKPFRPTTTTSSSSLQCPPSKLIIKQIIQTYIQLIYLYYVSNLTETKLYLRGEMMIDRYGNLEILYDFSGKFGEYLDEVDTHNFGANLIRLFKQMVVHINSSSTLQNNHQLLNFADLILDQHQQLQTCKDSTKIILMLQNYQLFRSNVYNLQVINSIMLETLKEQHLEYYESFKEVRSALLMEYKRYRAREIDYQQYIAIIWERILDFYEAANIAAFISSISTSKDRGSKELGTQVYFEENMFQYYLTLNRSKKEHKHAKMQEVRVAFEIKPETTMDKVLFKFQMVVASEITFAEYRALESMWNPLYDNLMGQQMESKSISFFQSLVEFMAFKYSTKKISAVLSIEIAVSCQSDLLMEMIKVLDQILMLKLAFQPFVESLNIEIEQKAQQNEYSELELFISPVDKRTFSQRFIRMLDNYRVLSRRMQKP